SVFVNAVMKGKYPRVFTKRIVDFLFRPNVKCAFRVLLKRRSMSADFRFVPAVIDRRYRNWAVRIFGRIESALWRSHVAPDVIKNVTRGCCEFRIASDLKSVEISARQLRLVVKHFLEMRHVPVGIDRIPMKSTANVI